ncbi:hypothetical protein DB346_00910 [Verrucomicrobia bacterium LW23]|nr:hypothetical protein DB346_00910 [Verrucomicrobia bacterium LW23]
MLTRAPHHSSLFATLLPLLLGLVLFAAAPVMLSRAAGVAPAKTANTDVTGTEISVPDDELGRGTPRSSVEGFFSAAQEGDFNRAALYLNLAHIAPASQAVEGPRLARQLWFVLERRASIDYEALSISPEGNSKDGLPPNRERVTRIEWPGGFADINMERVRSEDGMDVWKFSDRSLAGVPALYQRHSIPVVHSMLSDDTQDYLLRTRFLAFSGLTWIGIGIMLLCWGIGVTIGLTVTRWLIGKMTPGTTARLFKTIYVPLVLLVVTACIRFLVPQQILATEVLAVFRANTMLLVAFVWIIFRFADFIADQANERMRERVGGMHLVDLVVRVVKVVIVIIAVVVWLDNMGYRVTTLLASLGIIGLAVGLASQKFIEDLIAAITLHATGVVRRNESVCFGGEKGTVEDIGLRMTTIRHHDRTLLTMPNSTFAGMQIKNMARRDSFLFEVTLGLRYETTPDQMRYVLTELRELLYAHPKVVNDGLRVRFAGFGGSSLDIEIYCRISEVKLGEYLAVREDLNLRIMDIVTRAGAGFAFPSQTLYLTRDTPADPTAVQRAEDQVRAWHGANRYHPHKFSDERIAELSGTMRYPSPPAERPLANGAK